MAVVTSTMRVQQILLGRADAVLRPLGLSFARYEVLMLLSFSQRRQLPLGKIGERLQVNPASVTNAVDRLEEQRLVARTPNPADGRGTLATLTEKGRATAAEATAVMNRDVFGELGLAAADAQLLLDLLGMLRQLAGDTVDGTRHGDGATGLEVNGDGGPDR
ncbi:MAG: MarR family transcriptional regulator [Solirubrobacteraceae bacterium]